jgi:hypothetical protein
LQYTKQLPTWRIERDGFEVPAFQGGSGAQGCPGPYAVGGRDRTGALPPPSGRLPGGATLAILER